MSYFFTPLRPFACSAMSWQERAVWQRFALASAPFKRHVGLTLRNLVHNLLDATFLPVSIVSRTACYRINRCPPTRKPPALGRLPRPIQPGAWHGGGMPTKKTNVTIEDHLPTVWLLCRTAPWRHPGVGLVIKASQIQAFSLIWMFQKAKFAPSSITMILT